MENISFLKGQVVVFGEDGVSWTVRVDAPGWAVDGRRERVRERGERQRGEEERERGMGIRCTGSKGCYCNT